MTAMLRLWRRANDPHDDMRRSQGRSAGDRLPCATESCTAPCTTLPGVQERSHRAGRIENKRALDGDEEDQGLLKGCSSVPTNSAFLLKISLHTCSPRHSAAGLMLIDFHCGHDWAKIRFPGEINHKYSASPPTISNWTAGTYFYKWRK